MRTESRTDRAEDDAGYSNIYPEDYVGPAKCAECHRENHELWRTHAHSKMNLDATDRTVLGDFSGVTIRYGGGDRRETFHHDGDDFLMSLHDGDRLVRRYKVTRVVGSRFNQFYIGVQVEGPEPPEHPGYRQEAKLPFAYWFGLERWLPEIYFDAFPPAEDTYHEGASYASFIFEHPASHPWEVTCIGCHNTYPYVARFKAKGKGWHLGFPEGDIVRKWGSDRPRWADWYEQAKPIRPDELVTLGISCESCHFGGREHAVHGKPISFIPTSPALHVKPPVGRQRGLTDRQNPYVVNHICKQCHTAEVRRYPNGAGEYNSAEAIDLSRGA